MASLNKNEEESANQTVPDGGEEAKVKAIQSHYLRCPSPSNFSMVSESRFSMICGSDADSIFMEPIHLSSAIAAKQIINEELKPRGLRTESIPESMLETAEQLMVEDLYNRVKDMIDDRSPYNTPCVLDIQRTLVQDRLEAPFSPVDEVWPNIFIGEKSVAVNKARLKRMGITHILNAAHGTGVYTGEVFYSGMKIQYMGIEVDDFAETNISSHFRTAAEFLDEALLTHKGKVLVNSVMGMSRSAVLVTAYLMIFHHMTIMEALMVLRKKRAINPNEGFLKQLRQFNETLMEERDDDDDTLSQCSVIDNYVCVDGEESIIGVKANSIMVEEEEDSASVTSSVASSATAAELAQNGPDMKEMEKVMLSKKGNEETKNDEDDDVDDVDSMIREWQRRNEKYQSEEWWEAQLLSESEEDGESHPNGSKQNQAASDKDLESVTREDIRVVKKKVKSKMQHANYDSMSTSTCSSYSDLWKQRLKEIEEQAAARYHKKQNNNNNESITTVEEDTLDDDVESVLSDTSSMYNFCKRNKEKLTPLERWRVKRIQFGWNKKDGEGEVGALCEGSCGEQAEGESACTPALEDINLTAYQSWKLKQQKRLGEQNKDEIVELSKGEDLATIKRRQRRTELLERSKKTLEESQSISGWETESCFSGGTVPLSAFWTGAGITGPPTIINDDNFSMLSSRSSVISQTRSSRSQPMGLPQALAQVPICPVSTVQGPSGEQVVNLASIQSWIANVVTETLIQKQGEINLPPSRSGSELSFDRRSSILSGQCMNDDKTSILSGASHSSLLSHGKSRAESVLSSGGASNLTDMSGLGFRRNKITTTSVPLYSLFQDQVNMRKLDSMDKEIKSEMRDKMASYEVKKIAEDNKRSTLYKKKKLKEEEDQEQKKTDNLVDSSNHKKSTRSYGLSGRLNLSTVLERDKNTSIDEWLDSVRPPQRKQASTSADKTVPIFSNTSSSADQELTDHDLTIRGASYTTEELDENNITSRYRFRFQADRESSSDLCPEPFYPSRRSPLDTENYSKVFKESNTYIRAGASNAPLEEDGEESKHEYSTKKLTNYSQNKTEETQRRGGREEREGEYDISSES